MTTPTKEQIERIAKLIFITKRDEPITDMEYDGLSDYWDRCLGNHTKWRYRAKAKVAIAEWEKIKEKTK